MSEAHQVEGLLRDCVNLEHYIALRVLLAARKDVRTRLIIDLLLKLLPLEQSRNWRISEAYRSHYSQEPEQRLDEARPWLNGRVEVVGAFGLLLLLESLEGMRGKIICEIVLAFCAERVVQYIIKVLVLLSDHLNLGV